jgi:hypothetical protein
MKAIAPLPVDGQTHIYHCFAANNNFSAPVLYASLCPIGKRKRTKEGKRKENSNL